MDRRKARQYPDGRLVPYKHGQGWTVIPKVNGRISAQRAGLGVVRTIEVGEQVLKDLSRCTCTIQSLTVRMHDAECPVAKEETEFWDAVVNSEGESDE